MNLNHLNLLQFLIFLSFFYFFKKQLDIILDLNFPTYDSRKKMDTFWKFLLYLRTFWVILLCFIAFFLILNYELSFNTFIIFLVMIIYVFLYFLFYIGLIYFFIDKNKKNDKIVNFMSNYVINTLDAIQFFYIIYIMYSIIFL